MHGVMHIGKTVNAKVRTDDLRDLDTELGGWNLAPLRKCTGQFMVVKSISNQHLHY